MNDPEHGTLDEKIEGIISLFKLVGILFNGSVLIFVLINLVIKQ